MTSKATKGIASSIALTILLLTFNMCFAGTVTVSWDANTENDLAGYIVYIGEQSNQYTGEVNVSNVTRFDWFNLEAGKTYYFAVRAYDNSGNKSDFSQEVNITTKSPSTNPPELVDIVVRGDTQLDVDFSEPLESTSAENVANFIINKNISVLGAVLNNNLTRVHLITSAHQHGQSYVLTVNNLKDLDGNAVRAGTSKSYTIQNPGGDNTQPEISSITVIDANNLEVVFSEQVKRSDAENTTNFEINNSINVLQAVRTNNQSIVRLTTTAHQNGVTYRLTVNNIHDLSDNKIVNNSSYSYDVTIDDVDKKPPQLLSVVVNGATQIDLNFSEPVEKSSVENKTNYNISPAIELIGAILDNNKTTVHLITGTHTLNNTYTLEVSNIRDRADEPNTIVAKSSLSYVVEESAGTGNNPVTPQTFALFQNYPNPFNPETDIRFYLDKQRKIVLKVYNPLGQLVKTLKNEEMPFGFHTVVWDGTNKNNLQVPSGIYIYSLEIKHEEQKGDLLVDVSLERRVRRMTLLR